jgi:hypothetical protein
MSSLADCLAHASGSRHDLLLGVPLRIDTSFRKKALIFWARQNRPEIPSVLGSKGVNIARFRSPWKKDARWDGYWRLGHLQAAADALPTVDRDRVREAGTQGLV